jgi:hypothetical protein
MTSIETPLLVTRSATNTESLTFRYTLCIAPLSTRATQFSFFYMWKVRLVYRVFVRACSILTSTAVIVAPFSPLTGSILRPYNSPHQTFPFRLSLMCFHKRLETQMFTLCFLLSSATQEMLSYVVTYFLKQTTVTDGSTKITFIQTSWAPLKDSAILLRVFRLSVTLRRSFHVNFYTPVHI